MLTKALALFALVTIVRSNDVIVGLKTDGTKFFDENRQANPALWRQMDNVTIKAPENEVISRIVITDLRPEKDGDVKVVEGGEGQKNVTIELKSPTVFRGYEFHIEAYSSPEGQVPINNNQQSTTEYGQGDVKSTQDSSSTPVTNLDATSKIPDISTDKNVPAILTKDEEISDNERQGRNAKNDFSTEGTTEVTSTTLQGDVSTTPVTQNTESITENHSETSSVPNQSDHQSNFAPIPLYTSFNVNPSNPAISGKDISTNNQNMNTKDETRRVRDTETDNQKPTDKKLDLTPTNIPLFVSSTENDKEASTTEINAKPVEEKSEDKKPEDSLNASKVNTFENRKFTSIIPSKVEHPGPIAVNGDEKQRNARDANEKMFESLSTTESVESTTANENAETTTILNEDCITTEDGVNEHPNVNPQNPVIISRDMESTTKAPVYINNRQWNQRLNNPRIQSEDASVQIDQKTPGDLEVPNQSVPSEKDAEFVGNNHNTSIDHMEHKNPKISAITNFREKIY